MTARLRSAFLIEAMPFFVRYSPTARLILSASGTPSRSFRDFRPELRSSLMKNEYRFLLTKPLYAY